MSLWNTRPLNTAGNDPFGQNQGAGGNERLTADSAKCPSCGSNITYEPELGSMICRNCGNVYSADTLELLGSFGFEKEHDYTGDGEMSEEDKKRHEIVCNSCGAALVTDENTMSTMCPFCGSPALITRRMSREFKPDYIVPFKIDKDEAQKIMKDWLASRKYTPRGFNTKSRLSKMTALYVPFWLLDCCVKTDLSGTGKMISGLTTTIYEVNSTIKYYVKGVPFDASLSIANKLMEAVEPFDYSEMVKFESKYLQGFYADKYDQLPTDMTERMMRRVDKYSRSETELIAKKYSEYEERPEKTLSLLSDISIKYCLLPVWFMTVEFDGRQYQFAVNGQTGEASGQVPTSARADLSEKLNNRFGKFSKAIPLLVMLVCGFFLYTATQSDSISVLNTIFVFFLIICELLAFGFIMFTKILGITRAIKPRQSAYEANDFDEDPGLDCYFDSKRRADIQVNEMMLRHIVKITDENGNVINEHSVEV